MNMQTPSEHIEKAKNRIWEQVLFHEVLARVGDHKTVSTDDPFHIDVRPYPPIVPNNETCQINRVKLTDHPKRFEYRDLYREPC